MVIKQLIFVLLVFILSVNSYADTAQNKAELAVANILFDYSQGDEEFASYRVDEYGYVHVTFALNTPEKLYGEILTTLQQHSDIRDVISDKGGPRCQLW